MVCGASASETVDSVLIYILHTAVISSFKSPYLGNTAALEKAIDQVINDRNLYANAIPFVQSSGTGKSRLMGELAKIFFVLVLNLRENDNPRDFCKYCWKPVLEKLTPLQRSLNLTAMCGIIYKKWKIIKQTLLHVGDYATQPLSVPSSTFLSRFF